MEELPPLTHDELAALPVFPLPRAVFFPGSTLPLHLFEHRYREMMEACVSEGPMAMAITRLKPGYEDDYEGHPPIHEVAGAGRIIDWRRRQDGRFDMLLHGVERVRLVEHPRDPSTYRVAAATRLQDRAPHPDAVARGLTPVLATAATMMSMIRERHPDFELGLDAGLSPSQVADRIADRLVADPDVRQRLLETLDVKVRLAQVHEVMIELTATLRSKGLGGPLH
jgi:uncharacterized protein